MMYKYNEIFGVGSSKNMFDVMNSKRELRSVIS